MIEPSGAYMSAFLKQIEYDHQFAKDLCFWMRAKIDFIGRAVYHRQHEVFFMKQYFSDEEFLDFIDGNGFIVELAPKSTETYIIYPIYQHEVIDNESVCNRSI